MRARGPNPKKFLSRALLCAAVAAPLLPLCAPAQDFDYSSYAALFGEPVTRGVTGAPMRESESPFAVTILTESDIAASPSPDIGGLLTTVPGLDVVRRAMGQYDVGVRGFDEPKPRGLLVLINGRQVYLDSYGSTDWDALPIQKEEIKQIEIIRGPNGALYGFNAAEGVINIITDDPLYDRNSFAVAEYGTQAGTRLAGGATLPLGDFGGFRLTGSREDANEFTKLVAPNPANETDESRIALNGDLALRLGDTTSARIEMSHSETDHSEVGPLYKTEDNKLRTKAFKANIEHDLDNGSIDATTYINFLRDGVVYNQVWVTQGEYLRKLGARHTIRISAEYRDNYTHQMGAPIEFGIDYNVFSGALMWNWEARENLTLTNAARVDSLNLSATKPPPVGSPYTRADYDRTIDDFSFNSAAVWRVRPADQLRIEAARGLKIPSLVDFGMAAPIPDPPIGYLFLGGDPANKLTTVWNYEAGWRHVLPWFGISIDTTIFHTVRYDIIGAPGGAPDVATPVGYSFLFKNRGNTAANGVTIEASGHIDPSWTWSLNYTNVDVNDALTIPAVLRNFYPTDYQDSQPRHEANATVTYRQGRWLASLEAHYQSATNGLYLDPVQGFVPQHVKSFVDAGAKLAYKITDHVSISVYGTNLLDGAQREASVGEVDRRLFVALSASL